MPGLKVEIPAKVMRKGEDYPWEYETTVTLEQVNENELSLCVYHPDLSPQSFFTFTCEAVQLLQATRLLIGRQ